MNPSFGARLRREREEQQVTLAAIATQTKIKMSLLEGLERDDLSQWPKGIFRRSYVRAYAQAIGLDPDAIARELLELYPEPADEDPSAVLAAARPGSETSRPPTRLRLLLGSAIGALPGLTSSARQRGVPAIDDTAGAEARASAGQKPADTEPDAPAVASAIPAPRAEDASAPLEGAAAAPAAADDTPTAHRDHATLESPDPPHTDGQHGAVHSHSPSDDPPAREDAELSALAHLCMRLARVADETELAGVLEDAARLLDAVGLIVWMWNPQVSALTAGLAHGYSRELLSQLPPVPPETDNAIATAFCSGETRVVHSSDQATGAVVVPLMTPSGCAGVLAVELRSGGEQGPAVGPIASILAAQLSTLVGPTPLLHAATA